MPDRKVVIGKNEYILNFQTEEEFNFKLQAIKDMHDVSNNKHIIEKETGIVTIEKKKGK